MVNVYEFSKIKIEELPILWQDNDTLLDLEQFLQENWNNREFLYKDLKKESKQQFIDFDRKDSIKTQNYIGTIVYKGQQLNIFPKIFRDSYSSDILEERILTSNLLYWLGYCDKLRFPFINSSNRFTEENSLFELIVRIYLNYVLTAMQRKKYFQYEDINESGNFIKGRIDFNDYIVNRVSRLQYNNIKYTYSSFTFNNRVNQIIKATCKILLMLSSKQDSKDKIRKILSLLNEVDDIHCTPYDCDTCRLSKLNEKYQVILNMSKMFLLNKSTFNAVGDLQMFCCLFPSEVLFESFIAGMVKETFYKRAKVRVQASDQYLTELWVDNISYGNVFLLKEDIIVEYCKKNIIVDTKYKEIDNLKKICINKKLGISDSDMKQMIIYALKRNSKMVFLVYPLASRETLDDRKITYKVDIGDNIILINIIRIPFAIRGSVEETQIIQKRILEQILL